MIKEENLKEIPITVETAKIDVPKTGTEKSYEQSTINY